MFFATLTAASARRFPCGWYGEDVAWVNPYSCAKSVYDLLANCGALSVWQMRGIPKREKCVLVLFTMVVARVSVSSFTSSQSEKWQTVIKYDRCSRVNKSWLIISQGSEGIGKDFIGSLVDVFPYCAQIPQVSHMLV